MEETHGGEKAQQQNMLMGILCYLGPLVIVPFIMAKDDHFVKFHIRQGLVLLIMSLIVWALSMTFWQFYAFYQILNLGILVLIVLGIVNVVQGKMAELPLVGQFAKHFKI